MRMQLPAHHYLDKLGIPYEKREFDPRIDKGAAAVARELGFDEEQMVKTLLFESGAGERVLVMVGADRQAISGHLKKAIGDRNIRMCPIEEVKATTGYEVGSVPPFSWQTDGFRSFLDAALLTYSVVGVGAGIRGHEIIMRPADLVRASAAIVVNLTERGVPVEVNATSSD